MNGRSMDMRLLSRSELPMPAASLARWLVGKTLVREHRGGLMSGRIVETEAYVVGDASSHACLASSTMSGASDGARELPVFSFSSARLRSVTKRPWSIS